MFSTGTRTIAAACFATLGFGAVGAACQSNTDCKSNFCDSVAKVCTDVCFGNSDCTQQSGWRCRPESVAVQSGGTYSVLSCGK
jgi:hypothetical protein